MTRPDSTRWFEALNVDEAGRLWVLSRDLAGDAFAIVYRDNAAVAMIDLPDSARVLDIDADLIALLEADEMGVQAVAVYRYGPR